MNPSPQVRKRTSSEALRVLEPLCHLFLPPFFDPSMYPVLAATDLFLSPAISLCFLEFYLRDLFLPLFFLHSTVLLRIAAWVSTWFHLMAGQWFTVWLYNSLFLLSLMDIWVDLFWGCTHSFNRGTFDIWRWVILCCGVCPVCCWMFSSISGLYPVIGPEHPDTARYSLKNKTTSAWDPPGSK